MVPRFFILPAAMLAATAGYIAFGPSGAVGQPATTPTATADLAAAATPPATSTSSGGILESLGGKLTYRTGREQVTVQFPAGEEIAREPSSAAAKQMLTSTDGVWTATSECVNATDGTRNCTFVLASADGRTRSMQLDIDLQWSRSVQWSPVGHRLAILMAGVEGGRIAILNDPNPAAGDPQLTQASSAGAAAQIQAFAWASDDRSLIAAASSGAVYGLYRIEAEGGGSELLAPLPELPTFLYPSPDGSMDAFTSNRSDGWHLFLWDERDPSGVRDLGPMGSDGPDGKPVVQSTPDVKTPMYVAWSPDGKTLAFGGGQEPPYLMTIIDIASGDVRTTQFADGYPGEIKWSPDGKLLAVSSYNLPRTHHESYVVDPATGIARDVLSGCVIVWSPDSRYLAIHGEREPGVAIADVATLEHVQLTHTVGDTPLRWEP